MNLSRHLWRIAGMAALLSLLVVGAVCARKVYRRAVPPSFTEGVPAGVQGLSASPDLPAKSDDQEKFLLRLSEAALERTRSDVTYDPGYYSIPYPGGDVPSDIGVCADVVIRSYRALGIDLQQEVHLDMKDHFIQYPKRWGLSKPDTNIDHRRVYNLMTFFARRGQALPITDNPADYQPGDIVCWDVKSNLPHIGIVTHKKSRSSGRFMIVHNIGRGPELEDILFKFKIIGHYRYYGPGITK